MDDDGVQSKDQAENLGVEAPVERNANTDAIERVANLINSQRLLLDPSSSLRLNPDGASIRAWGNQDAAGEVGFDVRNFVGNLKSAAEIYEESKTVKDTIEVVIRGSRAGAVIAGLEAGLGEEPTAPRQLDEIPGATTSVQRAMNFTTRFLK